MWVINVGYGGRVVDLGYETGYLLGAWTDMNETRAIRRSMHTHPICNTHHILTVLPVCGGVKMVINPGGGVEMRCKGVATCSGGSEAINRFTTTPGT